MDNISNATKYDKLYEYKYTSNELAKYYDKFTNEYHLDQLHNIMYYKRNPDKLVQNLLTLDECVAFYVMKYAPFNIESPIEICNILFWVEYCKWYIITCIKYQYLPQYLLLSHIFNIETNNITNITKKYYEELFNVHLPMMIMNTREILRKRKHELDMRQTNNISFSEEEYNNYNEFQRSWYEIAGMRLIRLFNDFDILTYHTSVLNDMFTFIPLKDLAIFHKTYYHPCLELPTCLYFWSIFCYKYAKSCLGLGKKLDEWVVNGLCDISICKTYYTNVHGKNNYDELMKIYEDVHNNIMPMITLAKNKKHLRDDIENESHAEKYIRCV